MCVLGWNEVERVFVYSLPCLRCLYRGEFGGLSLADRVCVLSLPDRVWLSVSTQFVSPTVSLLLNGLALLIVCVYCLSR